VSVFDASSHELRELSVHEPQRFANRFAPLRAPFLDEILPRLSVFPACRAMVEIKHESLAHWGVAEIMDRLLDALEPYATGCLLISYRQDALDYARRHTSGLEVGWVLRRYDEAHLKRAETLAPEVLVCNQDKIPEAVTLRAGRWRWMLYDIVDPQLALDWAGRGASLIETADIGAMLRHPALARKGCSHGL
jgi:glycerophosphoryl diester phosphodiesterase